MNNSLSTVLKDYYARERETIATEPAVRAELRALGVVIVRAEYDGVGDSGQIGEISYTDGADPAQPISVADQINQRVEALLYALLERRHSGWEINDGGFGSFTWYLTDGTMEHEHGNRFTDVSYSYHAGFEIDTGESP